MQECTGQNRCLTSLAYALEMIKLIGFTGISLLANKYLLSICSMSETFNIIMNQKDNSPHAHGGYYLADQVDLAKSLCVIKD